MINDENNKQATQLNTIIKRVMTRKDEKITKRPINDVMMSRHLQLAPWLLHAVPSFISRK